MVSDPESVRPFVLLGVLLAFATLSIHAEKRPPAAVTTTRAAHIVAGAESLALPFVENRGQVDRRVRYYLSGRHSTIYFTNVGVTFAVTHDPGFRTREVVRLEFVGARSDTKLVAHEPAQTRVSYFKGSRANWKTDLPTYATLTYHDLWPGIDLTYTGTATRLKYTFVVRPGADPAQIELAYRGVRALKVNDAGELEVSSPAGDFRDEKPYVFQEVDGRRKEILTSYAMKKPARDTRSYGFNVAAYDRTRPLVIDPALLVYSGFIGGPGGQFDLERGAGIAVDASGNAYVTGRTESSPPFFPANVGPDLSYNGFADVFVAKISPDGTTVLYAGYIGGADSEEGRGIAVDAAGNAYVSGWTASNNAAEGFPITVGPDVTFNGASSGNIDAFVARINAAGTALDYCGYIGGVGTDEGHAVAVDSLGRAYVAGKTFSNHDQSNAASAGKFAVMVGPDLSFNGPLGDQDAFVARITADGSGFDYVGFIGGNDDDDAAGIAVDASFHAYVTGITLSSEVTFPAINGPDLVHGAPLSARGFLSKVKADGTGLDYSGYVSDSFHTSNAVAADADGFAYITGSAGGSLQTVGGPNPTFGGATDAFVAKVLQDGTGFVYSGYIGGPGVESGTGIAIDALGNAYIVGTTNAGPSTFSALGGVGGSDDVFVAKVEADGSAVAFSGWLGGSSVEGSAGIAVDALGSLLITGFTVSSNFPVLVGPDLTLGGVMDAFVAKIADPPPPSEWADLSLVKTAGPDPVFVDGEVLYQIHVTNNGPADAVNVAITDVLPLSLTSIAPWSVPCTINGNTLQCLVGSLASGATAEVAVTVATPVAGVFTNTATVSADTFDGNSADNTASAMHTVNPPLVDLSVTKIGTDINVFGNIGYQVSIHNNGPSDAIDVVVTDVLPPQLMFLFSPDVSPWLSCTNAANTVTCTIPLLPSGNIATATILAKVTTPGTIVNEACASSSRPDPDATNNCGEHTTVPPPAPAQPPEEQMDNMESELRELVATGVLDKGKGESLMAKLRAARNQASRGNTTAAINQLGAFVHQLAAFDRSRRLDPRLASLYIVRANAVIDALRRVEVQPRPSGR